MRVSNFGSKFPCKFEVSSSLSWCVLAHTHFSCALLSHSASTLHTLSFGVVVVDTVCAGANPSHTVKLAQS